LNGGPLSFDHKGDFVYYAGVVLWAAPMRADELAAKMAHILEGSQSSRPDQNRYNDEILCHHYASYSLQQSQIVIHKNEATVILVRTGMQPEP
jgi:hypothetical protein